MHTSSLFFVKYEGIGNDFLLIDDRQNLSPINATLAQELCDRRFGVGADGVILLQEDAKADFRMEIWNSDGSIAESCGNGLRCLARFLLDLGFPAQPYTIASANQLASVDYVGDLIRTELGSARDLRLSIFIPEIEAEVHYVDTGVPHVVLFVPDIHAIAPATLGPILRNHREFAPRGANVNFAMQAGDTIHVRTYERGVEGETWACGTGAAAVGVIGKELLGWTSPLKIQCKGGQLEVHLQEDYIALIGPANKVFEGKLFLHEAGKIYSCHA